MGGAIGVFFRARAELRFLQSTIDKTVFRVGDGRFGVGVRLFEHAGGGNVANVAPRGGLSIHFRGVLDQFFDVFIAFEQFDGDVARAHRGRNALGVGRFLVVRLRFSAPDDALQLSDAVLDFVSVVDVDVAGLARSAFIDLNDGAEQFLNARTVFERRGNQWHSEERAQRRQIDVVAAPLELVVHIECADNRDVHIDQLRRQIEVSLDVRRVDDVDDHVGHFFC